MNQNRLINNYKIIGSPQMEEETGEVKVKILWDIDNIDESIEISDLPTSLSYFVNSPIHLEDKIRTLVYQSVNKLEKELFS